MEKYLQTDFKSSQFVEYSKESKEDFVSEEGRKGYRKYYNEGVTGTLLNAGVRDSKIGQQLVITLLVEGDYVNLQVPLYDQKGNVDNNFAESVIKFLPNLKKQNDYRFYPYNISAEVQEKGDKEAGKEVRAKYYDSRGISVKRVTEEGLVKVEAAYMYNKKGEKDPTRVPSLEWKKDRTGKNKPSAVSLEAKNEFLLSKLMDAVDGHLAYESNNSTSSQQPNQEYKVPEPVAQTESEVSDDLPF